MRGMAFIDDLFDSIILEFRGVFGPLHLHYSILVLTSLFVYLFGGDVPPFSVALGFGVRG
jgi:hypothetical protein